MKRSNDILYIFILISVIVLTSCSMTKNIPEDDQLFIGLKEVSYADYEANDNFTKTQEEVEAALATAPNGSLFGSSYYRLPFSIGVSIYNYYSEKNSAFARWMTKSFGKQPVLMSWVNPELRANVAQSVLRNHGYFGAYVNYDCITQKTPKTAKISYSVFPGRLYTLDSVSIVGFPAEADSLIKTTAEDSYVKKGDPFVVSNLDAERQRISTLLRNNGYYYYQPGYASYLADTFVVDGKVQLQLKLANDIPVAATHKWYIGNIDVSMRKTSREVLTDSIKRRITIHFSGKKPPVRARVLMADIKLRPNQLYSHDNYLQSVSKLNAMGLFSSVNMAFTPRDTTALCDTLDLAMTCTFDKPWDFYVETNFNARTIGRMGPELRMGVTRRNAFRGAEKIDVNIHGSYEWATSNNSSGMNNYEYGADASVEFPRIIAPFFGGNRVRRDSQGKAVPPKQRFFSTPSTLAKASTDIIFRPGYYKMHVVSGEWTYRWQTSAQSRHEFSPLTVKYQFMNSHTDEFEDIIMNNLYLAVTMQDYFIPEMRYTYTYNSPSSYLHPIRWETTVAESGNAVALYDVLMGRKWNEQGKEMFKTAYSQFLRFETDFTKTWTLNAQSKLVGHVNAGVIYAYGNSEWIPNSELYYVGGANNVRAFTVRGIGPGGFPGLPDKSVSYMLQNGDTKFVCNLEYRRKLFGSLHGAVFLDAGNVWYLFDNFGSENDTLSKFNIKFKFKNFFDQLAVGTGIGIRYDLDFLVLRLDWGLALHYPYDTGKSGYFNMDSFKNSHTLHFAIGYPF